MAEMMLGAMELSNSMFFNVSLEGLYNWFKDQASYVLFIILIALLIGTIVKRAWLSAVAVLVGLAFIGVFIMNPEAIKGISSWLSDMINVG